MKQRISPIIQPTELINLDPHQYVLIDASAGSKARFDSENLAGAFISIPIKNSLLVSRYQFRQR